VQRLCYNALYSNEKKTGHQKAPEFNTAFMTHLYAAAGG
jgi:hypothetical protein